HERPAKFPSGFAELPVDAPILAVLDDEGKVGPRAAAAAGLRTLDVLLSIVSEGIWERDVAARSSSALRLSRFHYGRSPLLLAKDLI
ncbi:MAG: hypothetical protein ACK56F_28415, partial [bacterium]